MYAIGLTMITSTNLLRASAMDLRRIASEARLLLGDRPAPEDVEALRGLRLQLVADLDRFQQLVHVVLVEASLGGPARLQDAIGLKVEAIAMARAYDEFRRRWMVKQLTNNWAEYRLSALRMINTILVAIAPIDLLPMACTNFVGSWERDTAPILPGISRAGDAVGGKAKMGITQLSKGMVL